MSTAAATLLTPECKGFAAWDPEAKRWSCRDACGASGPAGWSASGAPDMDLFVLRHHLAGAPPVEVYLLTIDEEPMTPEAIGLFGPGMILGSMVRVADDMELDQVSLRSAEEIKRGFLTGQIVDVFQNALGPDGEPFNVGGLLAVTHSRVLVVRQ